MQRLPEGALPAFRCAGGNFVLSGASFFPVLRRFFALPSWGAETPFSARAHRLFPPVKKKFFAHFFVKSAFFDHWVNSSLLVETSKPLANRTFFSDWCYHYYFYAKTICESYYLYCANIRYFFVAFLGTIVYN